MVLSEAETRALRWRAQRLATRDAGGDPAAVVRAVGAIQSQDPAAAALGLRARGSGFDVDGVERTRVQDRTIVRTWVHRGTLHLVPVEDVGWLLRLLGRVSLSARERRFAKLGLDEDRYAVALRVLREALAGGPLTREEIGQRWQAAGIDASGPRLTHMITRAALEGEICDGPDRGRERTWVLLADWVDVPRGPDGEAALAELVRRHIAAHGPVEPRDLAAWSGLNVAAARTAWRLIGDELDEVDTPVGPRWLLRRSAAQADSAGADDRPVARLLPGFDAYLLGYADRTLAVPPPHTKRVQAGGLRVLPAVAVDGLVVGTWKLRRRTRRVEVDVDAFGALDRTLLDEELADLGRFLGVPASLT